MNYHLLPVNYCGAYFAAMQMKCCWLPSFYFSDDIYVWVNWTRRTQSHYSNLTALPNGALVNWCHYEGHAVLFWWIYNITPYFIRSWSMIWFASNVVYRSKPGNWCSLWTELHREWGWGEQWGFSRVVDPLPMPMISIGLQHSTTPFGYESMDPFHQLYFCISVSWFSSFIHPSFPTRKKRCCNLQPQGPEVKLTLYFYSSIYYAVSLFNYVSLLLLMMLYM